MTDQFKGKPEGVEMGLLFGGIALVLVAYFLPAVTFSGQRGGAVHGLSIFSKLPLMSALAFIGMAAAVATRMCPHSKNTLNRQRSWPFCWCWPPR